MKAIFVLSLLYTTMFFSLNSAQIQDSWKGDEYAKNSDSQKSSAEEFIGEFSLQGASSVLDVGCGDGKITAEIAKILQNGEIVGVDISPSMINFADTIFSSQPNLKFYVQDASKLDFKEKFDLVTSFTVMHWVLEQKEALACFEKALKPGGRLCIQMPTGLPTAMEQALNKALSSKKWEGHFSQFSPPWKFYQPEEYRDLLVRSHFSLSRIETSTKHEMFASRAVFQGFLRQWFPYLKPLPDDLKDAFLTELVDNYLQILPQDERGQVSFIVTRLEVEAKK